MQQPLIFLMIVVTLSTSQKLRVRKVWDFGPWGRARACARATAAWAAASASHQRHSTRTSRVRWGARACAQGSRSFCSQVSGPSPTSATIGTPPASASAAPPTGSSPPCCGPSAPLPRQLSIHSRASWAFEAWRRRAARAQPLSQAVAYGGPDVTPAVCKSARDSSSAVGALQPRRRARHAQHKRASCTSQRSLRTLPGAAAGAAAALAGAALALAGALPACCCAARRFRTTWAAASSRAFLSALAVAAAAARSCRSRVPRDACPIEAAAALLGAPQPEVARGGAAYLV